MKQFFIIVLLLVPSFSLAQDTSQTKLEDLIFDSHSFEEVIPLIEEEIQSWNHCDLPFFMRLLCFNPFFQQKKDNYFNEENLYPYQSLVDTDALFERYGDFFKQKIAFDLREQYLYNTYSEEQQKEILAYNEDFDTWEDYIALEHQQMFKSAIIDIIGDYTDGYAYFMENENFEYVQAWSALKMPYYLQWASSHFFPPYIEEQTQTTLAKAEAEALLGSTATLLRTTHSLYLQDAFPNSETIYDEYIWVNGSDAIGVYSKLRYQIVDESGQALAPLEDGVETRFGTKAFGDFEVVDIRVLFDLVEIEE